MDLSDRPERLARRNIGAFLEQKRELVDRLMDWSKQLAHYANTGETNEHDETHQKHHCEKNKQVAAWLEGFSDELARFSLLPGVIWLFFIDSDTAREIAVQCFLTKVDCIQQVLEGVISRLWNPPLFQPLYLSAEVITMPALAIGRLRLHRMRDTEADTYDGLALDKNVCMAGGSPVSDLRSETWDELFRGVCRCSCGLCLEQDY